MVDPEPAPRSSFVDAGGLRLRVLHWPGSAERPAFVLLHGLASNARFWELVGPLLVRQGHPVWAPDLRGHGQSGKPDDGYDFATQCSDVLGLVQVLNVRRPILVGHSWGGMVALEYAARNPDGPWSPSGLALVDGGIGQISDVPGATRDDVEAALTPPRLKGASLDDFVTRMNAHPRPFPLDERRLDIILANFAIGPDQTIAPHLTFERHMRLVREMWQAPVYRHFERVRCPVLIVPARSGDVRGVQAETYLALKQRGLDRAKQVMRDLRVVWMEDTDHDVPLHRPEALAGSLLELAARAEAGSPRASSLRRSGEVEIGYRRATAKDAGAIRALILTVGINPRGLDWRRFTVAVEGRDRVVGCGQIKPHPDGSRELASIAVRPKMRKRGVASELIRRLMEENGPPLWLMCRSGLAGFYQRFGFVAVDDPAFMPRYFQRIHRLAALAGHFLPREGRLVVMGWNENKPGFSQKSGLAD